MANEGGRAEVSRDQWNGPQPYDPSPKEIAAQCERIRDAWSENRDAEAGGLGGVRAGDGAGSGG